MTSRFVDKDLSPKREIFISVSIRIFPARFRLATVRTGCFSNAFPAQAFIFVRKTLLVRLRDRVGGEPPASRVSRSMSGGRQSAFLSCEHESGTLACRLRKVGGKGLRFSMKMMFAPVSGAALQPVRTAAACISCRKAEYRP